MIALGTLQVWALGVGIAVGVIAIATGLFRLARTGDRLVHIASEYPPHKLQAMDDTLTKTAEVLEKLADTVSTLTFAIQRDFEANTRAHEAVCDRLDAHNGLHKEAP